MNIKDYLPENLIGNGALLIAAKTAVDYVNQITKIPLSQIGDILGDKVRIWRYKNSIELLLKVKEYHQRKGISVKQIPVKTLLPLLENSSLEEDESLKNKWTALLANATDSGNNLELHNIFVELLRQLSSLEVRVLDFMYNENENLGSGVFSVKSFSVRIFHEIHTKDESFPFEKYRNNEREKEGVLIDNLIRLNLIEYKPEQHELTHSLRNSLRYGYNSIPYYDKREIQLSVMGFSFVRECRFKE